SGSKKSVAIAPNGKQWIELLQALRSEMEVELKTRSGKERQLNSELQALHQAELEQLQRLEEAKARLQASQAALQAQTEEEAALLAQPAPQAAEIEVPTVQAGDIERGQRVEAVAESYETPEVS